MSCYGGRPAMEEHRTMKGLRPQVIVGTPGRMNDHLSKQNFDAQTVSLLVIDEFDKCLELGFHDEMSTVIAQLPALQKRYLLSATDAEEIPEFTGLGRTVKLNFLQEVEPVASRLEVFRVDAPTKDKLETLYGLLCTLGAESTIVFCNYRESVERIGKFLRSKKVFCEYFHGGMEQDARERALYKFRNGSCSVFVSTDLAARGLDIPEIENVVHYHLPINEEGYIHRNGRTARWQSEGKAFVILHAEETLPGYCGELEPYLLPETLPQPALPLWTTLYIGKGKKDKLNKVDIVGFLYKKGGLTKEEVGRVDLKDHYALVAIKRKKLKQTLNLIKGEKIKGIKTIIEEMKG
jgi:superfamily II DNA/RNA helicase